MAAVDASDSHTILVVGANGFVGSYLIEHFAKETNALVLAYDRFSREPQFTVTDNVQIVRGDIHDDASLRAALQGVDYVMHSFSATTPFVSDQDPYIDVTSNLLRSIKLFDLCREVGVKKIGFISSGGAVYGTTAEAKTVTETDVPLPVSPYGIIKLSIEHYLEFFKRKFGIEYVAYRLTNPYGPRQYTKNNQGVIPAFLQKIQSGEEIVIYGDGSSSRDYIYADDAAHMIVTSFYNNNKFPVYNIGSGRQTSLNQILDELRGLLDEQLRVRYEEAPKTFLQQTSLSIERYCAEYGTPQFLSLQAGLQAVLDKR